ncbi:MAG: glutamyl-tRNA reductase [Gammaproteobacteria bacterium]
MTASKRHWAWVNSYSTDKIMALVICSISHRSAPIDVREQFALTPQEWPIALRDLAGQAGFNEAVILSTCHRTEVFCDTLHPHKLAAWLCDFHQLDIEQYSPYLTLYCDDDAVRHVMQTACGLDSMILGEPQILGQMKQAYAQAQQTGTVGKLLNRLFQTVFSTAKTVRSQTAIGANPVSVASTAVKLAEDFFQDLSTQSALLIGAGDTIELSVKHLYEHGVRQFTFANRTFAKAQAFTQKYQGRAVALPMISSILAKHDVVISATTSPTPILGKGCVERALQWRGNRPLLLIDLAMPRDIEPEVANLNHVHLYDVDALHEQVQAGIKARQQAAHLAMRIINQHVALFMQWLGTQSATHIIRSYRQEGERMRDAELQAALQALNNQQDPEQVITQLAHRLTNKLMHEPTVQLRLVTAESSEQNVQDEVAV